MTVLAILGYVAAIVVAVITIWNTATVSRLRLTAQNYPSTATHTNPRHIDGALRQIDAEST